MKLGQAEKLLLPRWKLGLRAIEQEGVLDLLDFILTISVSLNRHSSTVTVCDVC